MSEGESECRRQDNAPKQTHRVHAHVFHRRHVSDTPSLFPVGTLYYLGVGGSGGGWGWL